MSAALCTADSRTREYDVMTPNNAEAISARTGIPLGVVLLMLDRCHATVKSSAQPLSPEQISRLTDYILGRLQDGAPPVFSG